ncbi:MAG: hypothetical protein ACRDT6_09595 [Micromonosporaceae bacterium]
MTAAEVITEITYPDRGLLDSPVLWMAAGAMLAGVLVGVVALAAAVVGRLFRTGMDEDTAGTAGWELTGHPRM